jgi:hypothetical protein
MINEPGPDAIPAGTAMSEDNNICARSDENRKHAREAAEANQYSSFVQEAALRIFTADLGKILASDAVKCAEELADELEEQGYFSNYFPTDFNC